MIIRKYFFPILAAGGLYFAVWTVAQGSKPVPPALPVAEATVAPFETYIAGAGIVEASTENVKIGTHVSGIVTKVHVAVGSKVKAGDPLFEIDNRNLEAEHVVRQTELRTAKDRLTRLRNYPRPEDVPASEARVREAEVDLADAREQLALAQGVGGSGALSREELSRRRFAVERAEARLQQSRADLALLKAGSWKEDIAVAEAEVAAVEAHMAAVRTELERLVVRAPIDAEVLQSNVRAGEFAAAGSLSTPLMLIGNVDVLHVRVDVDENDAWRFERTQPATAYLRGNHTFSTPLQFVRLEPYVVPKRSLTGESTERVDTRVMQVLYAFPRTALPVLVGQQMDVFISATSTSSSAPATAPTTANSSTTKPSGAPQ